MVLLGWTGLLIPQLVYFQDIFVLSVTPGTRLQDHGVITIGGLGDGFPTSIWQKALRVQLTAPRRNSPPTQLRKMMVEVVVEEVEGHPC